MFRHKIFILYIGISYLSLFNFITIVTIGGCSVPGSPVICTVDAAGQARAKGEGLLSGHVGKPAHFIVTGTRSPPAVQVFTYVIRKLFYQNASLTYM